jgi:hypothetical protein
LKIRGTYDNQRCLFCHGPVKTYRGVPEHARNAAAIANREFERLAGADGGVARAR